MTIFVGGFIFCWKMFQESIPYLTSITWEGLALLSQPWIFYVKFLSWCRSSTIGMNGIFASKDLTSLELPFYYHHSQTVTWHDQNSSTSVVSDTVVSHFPWFSIPAKLILCYAFLHELYWSEKLPSFWNNPLRSEAEWNYSWGKGNLKWEGEGTRKNCLRCSICLVPGP